MFNTPILFLVFNRPDTTRQVFERIRQIRPSQLFVAADGPRHNKEGEQEKTDIVRQLVLDSIDWDCEVETLFQEQNLGCGKAVSEGITWFFEHVEQGIILEDDTLPDLSFFGYCEELLTHYQDNEEVMLITGSNFQGNKTWGKGSYFFSNYVNMWGWASWRRAWQHYDFDLVAFDIFEQANGLESLLQTSEEVTYWRNIFKSFKTENRIDTWDYQWIFSVWNRGGLTITPNQNLITNLGFGADATHTSGEYLERLYKKKAQNMEYIVHPNEIQVYSRADLNTFQNFYHIIPSFSEKLKSFVKRGISKIKGQ